MMNVAISRYARAVSLLPERIREEAKLPERMQIQTEEIRLRAGRKLSVVLPEGEIVIGRRELTSEELCSVVEIATGASAYAVKETMKSGYITAEGGYRIGVCGSAVVKNGCVDGFRELSSLSIRIPREIKGVARNVLKKLACGNCFQSTLIVSPPGGGKTTLLRDMLRTLSDGDSTLKIGGMRMALADERGEIACLRNGIPERDVGSRTDVLEGCPKAQAAMLLLRTMNPQVIVMDEITEPEDLNAIFRCANCGIKLLATAHGESINDLKSREMYLKLLKSGIFMNAVFIEKDGTGRRYTVEKIGGGMNA